MEGPATDSFDVLPGKSYRSFTEAAASVLQTLEGRLPGSVVYVAHLDDAENELRIIDSRGDASFGLLPGTASPLDQSFSRLMAFEAAPRLANFTAEVDAYRDLPCRAASRIGSYLGVPLAVDGDQTVACLCALSHETDSYTDEDLRMIGLMGRMLAVQLQNEQAERSLQSVNEHLRELSCTDPLTGVLNRRGLEPLLDREWRLSRAPSGHDDPADRRHQPLQAHQRRGRPRPRRPGPAARRRRPRGGRPVDRHRRPDRPRRVRRPPGRRQGRPADLLHRARDRQAGRGRAGADALVRLVEARDRDRPPARDRPRERADAETPRGRPARLSAYGSTRRGRAFRLQGFR